MKTMVKTETIVRLIVLILALINQTLTAAGKSPLPFEDETVTEFVSLAITVAAAAWAWWKNNSFTHAALEADEVLRKIREKERAERNA